MTPVVWLWLLSVVMVATVVGMFCYGLGQRNEARRQVADVRDRMDRAQRRLR